MDGFQKPVLDRLVVTANHRLERRDHVAHHIFRRIVQQGYHLLARRKLRIEPQMNVEHQQRMLGDGKGMIAPGLAVPAGNARKSLGNVLDLHIERRGFEQIEPAARKHALPGARRLRGACGFLALLAGYFCHGRPDS